MWELLVEFIPWIFGRGTRKTSSTKVEQEISSTSKREKGDEISKKALQYYNSAEQNRKAGNVKEAEKNYWESIKRWKKAKQGSAPAPFRKLAKLYYHTGFTEKSIEVLDSYPRIDNELESLKERFKKGDFRQLKNKYDEKPTGNYP